MKKAVKSSIKFILIAIVLIAVGLILYSVTVYQKDYPEYSSHNAKPDGNKALYLLVSKMGYPVERNYYAAEFVTQKGVMVAFRPDTYLFNEQQEQQSLLGWLENGNTLILIPEEAHLMDYWIFDTISERMQWHDVVNIDDMTVTWYGLENGIVCVMDRSEEFLNKNLSKSDAAVAFIRTLERLGRQNIIFNEYYHYLQKAAPGVWELLGKTGQLIAIQLVFAILVVLIRGWKPIGRVRGDKELVKRPENETLKVLSNLYIRMKAYPLALTNYYGYFTQQYDRFLRTPSVLQEKALDTVSACRYYIETGTGGKKEFIRLVRQLEELESQMKGR